MSRPTTPTETAPHRRKSTHSSERLELLISKYKRLHKEQSESPGASPLLNSKKLTIESKEEESLNKINKQLTKNGYNPINAQRVDNKGTILLNEDEVEKLSQTLTTLLDDIQRKDMIITELTAASKVATPIDDAGSESLQKQLKELQYTNAKLRVDMLNRPHAAELRICQQRLKELEEDLHRCKNGKKFDDINNTSLLEQLKNVGTLLNVDQADDIIPAISLLQHQVQEMKDIEPHLKSIASISCTLSHSSLHCPTLWSDIIKTIENWKQQFDELKELRLAFGQLYTSIEKKKIKENEITCKHMSDVLQSWLAYKSNKKSAHIGVVLAMLNHFQHLFDISSLDGVYPVMTSLYRQLHESTTAHKQLTELLGLPSSCSWQQLVMSYEKVLEFKEKELYFNICDQYGELSYEEIMQSLSLCRYFFPPFHSLITELQTLLGVESLSAVIPAVKTYLC